MERQHLPLAFMKDGEQSALRASGLDRPADKQPCEFRETQGTVDFPR